MPTSVYPPGPRGQFWGGNWPEYRRNPLGFLTHCARTYGDVVSLRFGRKRFLLLNHPDYIEYVLVTGKRYFPKHSRRLLHPILGNGLLSSEGDAWLRQRRLAQPAFQRQRLEAHGEAIVALTERMLATWQDAETRDVHEEMMQLMVQIAANTLFGVDVSEDAQAIGQTLEIALKHIEAGSGSWLPGWLPTPSKLRQRQALRSMDTMIYHLIEQRRERREIPNDLLSLLLQTQVEEDGSSMDSRQLRDEILTLFVASRETTALALSWTWCLLAQDAAARAELEGELNLVLGERSPTVADLPKLRYSERVLMESMRLFPPAYGLGREAIQDCEIGGYHVAAGTMVILPQWVLHRDPRYFSNPDQFEPNRWADGFAQRIPKFAYFPFGGGPRLCLGNSFAMMTALLVLATVAQRFRLALAAGHVVTLWPAVTLRPRHGIRVVLIARRKQSAIADRTALRGGSTGWTKSVKPVSVVVTTYDDDRRLELALWGYCQQTFKDFELIVVNDGGPRPKGRDATGDLMEGFSNRLNIRYLYLLPESSDYRLAAARNLGIKHASGQSVIITDGDCVPDPDMVRLMVEYARDDRVVIGIRKRIPMTLAETLGPQDLARLPGLVYQDDERLWALSGASTALFLSLKDAAPPRSWELCWGCLFSGPLWRFKILGGFDEKFVHWGGEDQDMAERLVRGAGCRLYSLPEAYTFHLDHAPRDPKGDTGDETLAKIRQNFTMLRNGGPMPLDLASGSAEIFPSAPATTMSNSKKVSFCIITRNEEVNLPACLISTMGLADEVIVVDTGSTDNTREVARQLGARVVDFPWTNDFSAARNESLGQATGSWIFCLDADERVDADNHRRLRELFAALKDENAAYAMRVLSLPRTPTSMTSLAGQVRLFRNDPQLRWQYRVHEQILPALLRNRMGIRQTEITIEHFGYQGEDVLCSKLERNLRLLTLENAEHPENAFTLFNLGFVYLDLRQPAEALPHLERSLELAPPRDPFVRKLFAVLSRTQSQLGEKEEALETLRTGQARFADDPELLFLEGVLLAEQRNYAEAEARLVHLLQSQELADFAQIHPGLRGYLGRHYLAAVYCAQCRFAEAEAEWRKALADWSSFTPAWRGLGELYLEQARWDEFATVVKEMKSSPGGQLDSTVLEAEGHLAREEFSAAREKLLRVIDEVPQAPWPKVVYSRTLVCEGKDLASAEQSLLHVLELDPENGEAQHNLRVVREQLKNSV